MVQAIPLWSLLCSRPVKSSSKVGKNYAIEYKPTSWQVKGLPVSLAKGFMFQMKEREWDIRSEGQGRT